MQRTPIDKLLKHIAHHRVMLAPLLARRTRRWKYWLRVLRENKLVRAYQGVFSTRLAVYQLTPKACKLIDISTSRARPFGPEALAKWLTLGWLLTTTPTLKRWGKAKLCRLFVVPPPGIHLREESGGKLRLYLTYLPSEDASVRSCIRRLELRLCAVRQTAKLRDGDDFESWLTDHSYSFLCVVDQDSKARAIRRAVQRTKELQQVYVRVVVSPGPRTLPQAIRNRRNHGARI